MRVITPIIIVGLNLANQVQAEQIKCVSGGKTIYTDDPRLCSAGVVRPIAGNVVITTLPNAEPFKPPAETPVLDPPPLVDQNPPPEGVSEEDLAKALKTMLDIQKRNALPAREIPDEMK